MLRKKRKKLIFLFFGDFLTFFKENNLVFWDFLLYICNVMLNFLKKIKLWQMNKVQN